VYLMNIQKAANYRVISTHFNNSTLQFQHSITMFARIATISLEDVAKTSVVINTTERIELRK
jgi:hypothetical protein